jgi:GxxExxY protein
MAVTSSDMLDEDITYAIIGAARRVYDELASGFLESTYVAALMEDLNSAGLRTQREVPAAVYYRGVIVGSYRVDLLVEARVVVEVKCCSDLNNQHFKQTLHYLKCTDSEVALLINFGQKFQIKRFVLRNELKGHRLPGSPPVHGRSQACSNADTT